MYSLNNKWNKIESLGPLEYYLYDGDDHKGGVLEKAKIVPPFSSDKILNIIKNNWIHLTDHEKNIFVYNDITPANNEHDGENTISTYNPLLCFCNYYDEGLEDSDDPYDSAESFKFVLFIKKLTWEETLSEGCGWADYECDCEIYLARCLDDIVKYAILPNEDDMFD